MPSTALQETEMNMPGPLSSLDVMDTMTRETSTHEGRAHMSNWCEVHHQVQTQDRGRWLYEMLKVCLDDYEALQLLTLAAEDFARDTSPACVGHAVTSAQLAAMRRRDGSVRGVAT